MSPFWTVQLSHKSHTFFGFPAFLCIWTLSNNDCMILRSIFLHQGQMRDSYVGVDRLSAPILSILPIIDIGHFKNRFADNYYFFFLCKQTYYLQVTLFIGE